MITTSFNLILPFQIFLISDNTSDGSEEDLPENREDNYNDMSIQYEYEREETNVEDENGGKVSKKELENEEVDIEENLRRFKKALMESIKKVIESYHRVFCKNINSKDFNQLIDEFIKTIINYEEIESAEFNKVTYNPTPIIELRKQEKRIKTQLPYIPECVKGNQPVLNEALDIDSDLKFLEDLIQNDSLFSTDETPSENPLNVENPSNVVDDNKEDKKDRRRSKEKKVESHREKSSKDTHKISHSKSHDLSSSSKDKAGVSKGRHKFSSASSLNRSSSSSKDSHGHSSSSNGKTSKKSKHSSSHKQIRSKSHNIDHFSSSKSKKGKHSSSSPTSPHKSKSASSTTIVISSESSDEDSDGGVDVYSNMDVDDDQDNGENEITNDNSENKQKETQEENYDEPDYIRKKKKQRIAHVDIFGVPSNLQSQVSNRSKILNPNERFKQIQEKYKGLNRSQSSHTPDTNAFKISYVPNVNSMLTAKKTITQDPPPLSMNKNSLLMNDVLKRTELKKTIAQTSKKNNRVAHVPSSGTIGTKPMIQVDSKTGTRIPLVVRQSCLDRIFALYSKYVPPDLAASRSIQVEIETYEKCHAAKSYQNSIANSILRIRKEQAGFFMGSKSLLR